MLKPPRVGGADQLRLFVSDVGGLDRAARIIDVHPDTLRRWLAGTSRTPQAAIQALYWLSRWGYSDACAEAHWSHQYLAGQVRFLQGEVQRLMKEKARHRAGRKTRERVRRQRATVNAWRRFV